VRTPLFGPMGYERDTHGMNNGFQRGFDGWLYACHGFNNETRVAGQDGHEIVMQSGNTYRMRLDGSRVEQFTWGQVNPFGMTMDPTFQPVHGRLPFQTDLSVSSRGFLSQLRQAPRWAGLCSAHDGPPAWFDGHRRSGRTTTRTSFRRLYQGNLFSGNVMTSRVNRNSLVYHGSTILCQEEEDFVKTTDPWFRPVDIQLGPDGALYIADFYNRIIGHYEVPLDHPGRDRTSGRIWRVRYVGERDSTITDSVPAAGWNLVEASLAELLENLADPNLTRRLLALEQIVDRIGEDAVADLRGTAADSPSAHARAAALWGLERLDSPRAEQLRLATEDEDPVVRTHAMKVLSEQSDSNVVSGNESWRA
jgi:hypothetical protein